MAYNIKIDPKLPRGPRGFKGDTGDTGRQGLTGPIGPAGPAGATGATGATGAQGAAAETQDSGWIAVSSLANNFTSPTAVAYRKLNNVVYLRGNLFGGTAGTGAFTLPVGYRPSVEVVVPVQKYGTANLDYITIGTNGVVLPNSTAAWLSSVIFVVG